MVVRLKITIEQEEYTALLKIALVELRNPEDQVHYILRKELIRQGLLPKEQLVNNQEVQHYNR